MATLAPPEASPRRVRDIASDVGGRPPPGRNPWLTKLGEAAVPIARGCSFRSAVLEIAVPALATAAIHVDKIELGLAVSEGGGRPQPGQAEGRSRTLRTARARSALLKGFCNSAASSSSRP